MASQNGTNGYLSVSFNARNFNASAGNFLILFTNNHDLSFLWSCSEVDATMGEPIVSLNHKQKSTKLVINQKLDFTFY